MALLLAGMSQAATTSMDSGAAVEPIASLGRIEQVARAAQRRFWQLVPPATDDPFYLDSGRVVRVVDWGGEAWPKPFLERMHAEMGTAGASRSLYPFYRLSVVEERSGDMVYYNSFGQEAWRTSAPKDYNPYLFAFLEYGVSTADALSDQQKLYGRSSNVGMEIVLIPEIFARQYEEDAAMDPASMQLATESATTTEPGIPRDGTASAGEGGGATNIPATLTFSVPSDFGSPAGEIFQCTNLVAAALSATVSRALEELNGIHDPAASQWMASGFAPGDVDDALEGMVSNGTAMVAKPLTLEAPIQPMATAAKSSTSGTPSVGLSSGIGELAHALGGDVAAISKWVHDNIDYVPYYGLMQGAEITLQTRCGNDADQAALMVELCRAAGYEMAYVVGLAGIPKAAWFPSGTETLWTEPSSETRSASSTANSSTQG